MSGFVEKLFDSFANKHGQEQQQQQQQQSYGYQQEPPQQQQQLPHPWISRWDEREQRYIYINEMTGERSWTPPQQQSQNYGGGGYESGYGDQREKEGGHGGGSNAAAWGVGGAALGLGAGALLMHEGEEMSEYSLSFPFLVFLGNYHRHNSPKNLTAIHRTRLGRRQVPPRKLRRRFPPRRRRMDRSPRRRSGTDPGQHRARLR